MVETQRQDRSLPWMQRVFSEGTIQQQAVALGSIFFNDLLKMSEVDTAARDQRARERVMESEILARADRTRRQDLALYSSIAKNMVRHFEGEELDSRIEELRQAFPNLSVQDYEITDFSIRTAVAEQDARNMAHAVSVVRSVEDKYPGSISDYEAREQIRFRLESDGLTPEWVQRKFDDVISRVNRESFTPPTAPSPSIQTQQPDQDEERIQTREESDMSFLLFRRES